MKLKKIALVSGGLAIALGAMTVAACSSSTPSAVVPPGGDSGQQNQGDSGTTNNNPDTGTINNNPDTGTTNNPDTGTGTDSGPNCKLPTLHPNPAGAIYCGFDDGGTSFDCNSDSGTQQCCLGGTMGTGFAPQVCAPFGSACTNGTGAVPIACGQVSDCTANGVVGAACCLQGVTSTPAVVPGCPAGDLKESKGTAIACEVSDAGAADDGGEAGTGGGVPSCATGELQICSADLDCPTGKTCIPMHWKLYNMGFCQ